MKAVCVGGVVVPPGGMVRIRVSKWDAAADSWERQGVVTRLNPTDPVEYLVRSNLPPGKFLPPLADEAKGRRSKK